MGGYVVSPTVTRGVHVHHSSAGTWFITPDTCLPQPHHVVLSVHVVSIGVVRVVFASPRRWRI